MPDDLPPDLQPDVLLGAYAQGIFPMDNEAGELRWFRPLMRGLLPLDDRFHVGKNLRKRVRQQRFDVTTDRDFAAVMHECADEREMWISDRMIAAYVRLHEFGFAHSVEVWQKASWSAGSMALPSEGRSAASRCSPERQTPARLLSCISLTH